MEEETKPSRVYSVTSCETYFSVWWQINLKDEEKMDGAQS